MTSAMHYLVNHLLRVETWLIFAAWVSAFAGAVIYYVWQYQVVTKSFHGFISFLLPPALWTHPSCRRDYGYAILNGVIERVVVGSLLIGAGAVSVAVASALSRLFGQYEAQSFSFSLWLAMVALTLLITDFSTYVTHRLEHEVPILWEIHKVHHSAEFLNPISNRRHHFMQLVWEGGVSNIATGMVMGAVSYWCRVPVMDNMILGADAFFFGNVLSFYQLRHSHVPLRYGALEKWFLSPAQHQLHHSVEVQDWDRNYGLLTSIWDRLFSTINYAKPGYTYRLGLQAHEQRQYDRVWKLFTTPLVNIATLCVSKGSGVDVADAELPRLVPAPGKRLG